MNDFEFMQQARKKIMTEKRWTQKDFEEKVAELANWRVDAGNAKNNKEKIRLWMQIQNEGRRVLALNGADIRIVCEDYVER